MNYADDLTSVSFSLMKQTPSKWINLQRYFIGGMVVLILWASLTSLDVMVFAIGKAIPASKVRTVQHLEGGIIDVINVRKGDYVKAGDVLVSIENVTIQSRLAESENRLRGIDASLFRLRAEIDRRPLDFDTNFLTSYPGLATRESELYAQRITAQGEQTQQYRVQLRKNRQELGQLTKQLKSSRANIVLMEEEVDLSKALFEQDAVSKVELLQLQRRLLDLGSVSQRITAQIIAKQSEGNRIQQKMDEFRAKFAGEAMALRNKLEKDKRELVEHISAANDRVGRSDVTSPVSGTVNQVFVDSIGSVVSPGMKLVEIVPQADDILIEAKVLPEDIAQLSIGQKANVRITAYDFSIFGSMPGEIEYIGADTIEERDGAQFYIAHVRIDANLIKEDNQFPIISGMNAKVDVITGKRTVISYITKPVTKTLGKALREQ